QLAERARREAPAARARAGGTRCPHPREARGVHPVRARGGELRHHRRRARHSRGDRLLSPPLGAPRLHAGPRPPRGRVSLGRPAPRRRSRSTRMTIDPPRLLDDPSVDPALRGDLQHAVAAELHGLDLAAGLSQLRATTAGSTAASGSSLLAKLGLGTAVTGGAVALWLGLGGPSPDPGGPAAVAEATPTASDPASERAVDEHAPALGAERGPSTAPAIEPRPTVVPTEALEPE